MNRMMNFHLILIFLLISIRFLLNGFLPFGYLSFFKEYYINFSKFLILIIPSFYLYFKNLIADEKLFIKADLAHFIFPIAFLVLNISIVSTNHSLPDTFYFTSYSVLFLYNITYCILAYHILKKYVWVNNSFSPINKNHDTLIKKWTFFLFIILLINSIKLFVTLFLEDNHHLALISGDRFQWVGAIIWILTFLKILISPEILYGYPIYNDSPKETENSNTPLLGTNWNIEFNKDSKNIQDNKLKEKIDKNIVRYIVEIEKASKDFELFRDPKFSLPDLALKLNIPNSNLNYLFKYHSKISFSDYKKTVRIHRSIQMIETNYLKTQTLDTLAKEVGFASYNPFFTSFKNITGISPQKYIAQMNDSLNKKGSTLS
jgi:AraC-like DNA-binding protein